MDTERLTVYQATVWEHLLSGPSSAGLTNEFISLYAATGLTKADAGGGTDAEKILVHEIALSELQEQMNAWLQKGLLIDYKIHAALFAYQNRPSRSEKYPTRE